MKTYTTVLLVFLLAYTFASDECGAGRFKVDNPEKPCEKCWMGYYCPGDDLKHKCPPGTAQEFIGRASCEDCPSGRSESFRFFCLDPSTPKDAQEFTENDLTVSTANPYWYGVVSFDTFSFYVGKKLTQYSFLDVKQPSKLQLAVYGSTTNGKPSKNDHEFQAMGENATIAIPNDDGDALKLVYFNIVPIAAAKATVTTRNFPYLGPEYNIDQESVTIEAKTDFTLYPEVSALFTVKTPKENSKVTVSVSLEEYKTFSPGPCHFMLYHSSIPTVDYPNMYNADVVSNSTRDLRAVAKISGQSEGGFFTFQLITSTIWNALLHVNTTLDK